MATLFWVKLDKLYLCVRPFKGCSNVLWQVNGHPAPYCPQRVGRVVLASRVGNSTEYVHCVYRTTGCDGCCDQSVETGIFGSCLSLITDQSNQAVTNVFLF